VLQWNLHHGVGTDGKYDIVRLATWMAAMTPDVVMLNEVEKYTGWGNENQPERYRALLEATTGKVWYSHFTQEYGNWTGNGKGSQILSTFPLEATDQTTISYGRVIGAAAVTVNGRIITLMETHLDPESQAYRLTQAKQVINWALARPENRIIAGDLNAWPDQSSIAEMRKAYVDGWEQAAALGKARTFPGNNPVGATKNGRIDYIFYSRGAANLTVVESQVVDTRNAAGVMPSDHRPVVTTFEVR
jgi:endonuclease/exonuclease/phosphatase family metal-dependent hydrolase